MRLIQVTLGAGATQISPNLNGVGQSGQVYCSLLIVQNNATHNVRDGDNTVSATKGILLFPTASTTDQIFAIRGTMLAQWYLYGTQADVIDILYETSN